MNDETRLTVCKCTDYTHHHYIELGGKYLNIGEGCDKVQWKAYMDISKIGRERI
jgi:hypothetical protein